MVIVLFAALSIPGEPQMPGRRNEQAKPDLAQITPTKLGILRGHKRDVWRAAFHPNGKTLVSCGDDAQLITWNVLTGMEIPRDHILDYVMHDLDFDAQGRFFAAVSLTPWGPGFPAFSGFIICKMTW